MAEVNPTCSVSVCRQPAVAKGHCHTHRRRVLTRGVLYKECKGCGKPIYETDRRLYCNENCRKKCSIEGCKNHVVARGLCSPHYSVVVRKGREAETYQEPKPLADSYACIVCGKEYEYWGSTKFCSHKCRGLYEKYGVDVPSLDFDCVKCGKHVKRDRFEKKFMSANRVTCDNCSRRANGRGFYSRFYRSEAGMAENCALCGESVDRSLRWPHPLSKSIDHIIPLAAGGTDDLENLQLAHLYCNQSKHADLDRPVQASLPI